MEGMNHVIAENLEPSPLVSVFGLFSVPMSVVISWGITVFLVALSILLTRNLRIESPGKTQVALEMAVGFLNKFCQNNLGRYWRPFAPWLGTVALYILCCNLMGLLGLPPPTKELNVTVTLALLSVLLIYGSQFRYRGLWGGLKKFAAPMPLLLPINLMEIAIRPLSLSMRLFGNVLATHVIMEMVRYLVPMFLPVVFSLYCDLFDGIFQTLIFVFLTTLFTSEGIHDHD